MKILLTGSSGRIGRAIFGALAANHEVVGLDRSPFATTRIVADVTDRQAVARAVRGVDAVIHTAALHAPHVGLVPDTVFQQINVEATAHLLQAARDAGARRFVLTSTTALYGHAVVAGGCRWIDEDTEPLPRTIYHRTKLQAETLAEAAAPGFSVRVLRMGRCFPEPPERMAMFRLRHRRARCGQRTCRAAATTTAPGSHATSPVRRRRSAARTAWSWPPIRAACWPAAHRSCWPSSSAVAGHCH